MWIVLGILLGAAATAVAAYFLPEERETVITRDVVFEDVRDKAALFGPLFKK